MKYVSYNKTYAMMKKCLSHVKVLDLSRVFAGPFSTQLLADLGAEVIKVEHPVRGDDLRQMAPFIKDPEGKDSRESIAYIGLNRGKRSITVDFSTAEGQAIIQELAADSDVLVENFKVGTLKKYHLDYESLRSLNPNLVYCSISGFGQDGPYSQRLGYDIVFQAMSGLMDITGLPDDEAGGGPVRVGYSTVDMTAGLYAVYAILAALSHRDNQGGGGQYIDLALLDAQVSVMSHMSLKYLTSGDVPTRTGNTSTTGAPVQCFNTLDFPLIVSVGNELQWSRFCDTLDLRHLLDDERFNPGSSRYSNRAALIGILQDLFLEKSAAEWVDILQGAGVPAAPLNNMEQVFEDPQVKHRGLVKYLDHSLLGSIPTIANPANLSRTPPHYEVPPMHGEHTGPVLREMLGMSDLQLQELSAKKVI